MGEEYAKEQRNALILKNKTKQTSPPQKKHWKDWNFFFFTLEKTQRAA